jgi:hypothetical protein
MIPTSESPTVTRDLIRAAPGRGVTVPGPGLGTETVRVHLHRFGRSRGSG